MICQRGKKHTEKFGFFSTSSFFLISSPYSRQKCLAIYRSGFRVSLGKRRYISPKRRGQRREERRQRCFFFSFFYLFQGHFGTFSLCLGINPVQHWYACPWRRKEPTCVFKCTHRNRLWRLTVTRLVTLPFSSNPSERSWACNLSMPGNATPILCAATHNLFVCISKTTTAQLNAIIHDQRAPSESPLSRNRISHLWFKIQKASVTQGNIQELPTFLHRTISSAGKVFRYQLLYLTQQISRLPFYSLLCSLCLSPKVRERLFETTKGPTNGEKCRGRVNWWIWLEWCLPMKWHQMTRQQMHTQRLAPVDEVWLLGW